MPASFSTRWGSSSLATSLARFHSHPSTCSHRRTVSADTTTPPPGPQLQGDRGAAPAGAAPTAGPRRSLENRKHRTSQGGRQPRPPCQGTSRPFLLQPLQVPGPVCPHHAIDGGARTEQYASYLGGCPTGNTQQEQVQGQQVPIPGPAQLSQHAGLL